MSNAEAGRKGESADDRASFWEIFKHAWPVVIERPKPLLLFVVALAAATWAVDIVSDMLQAPYQPFIEALKAAAPATPDANR